MSTWYILSFLLVFWLPPNTELIRKQVLFPKASVLRGSGLFRSSILCVNRLPSCFIILHSPLSHFICYLTALAIIFLRSFLVTLISLCLSHSEQLCITRKPFPCSDMPDFMNRWWSWSGGLWGWELLRSFFYHSFTFSLHAGLSSLSSTLPG